MTSHEAVCLLNADSVPANVELIVFFEDRDPAGPYPLTVGPRRTRHVRLNDLTAPHAIPRDTNFSTLIRSDTPIVVQHTRLDSRQSENALLSTIAYPVDSISTDNPADEINFIL
jgi:hypothetical protein